MREKSRMSNTLLLRPKSLLECLFEDFHILLHRIDIGIHRLLVRLSRHHGIKLIDLCARLSGNRLRR